MFSKITQFKNAAQEWADKNPDTCKKLKNAGIGIGAVAALACVAAIAIYLKGNELQQIFDTGVNAGHQAMTAGSNALHHAWSAFTAKHQITTAEALVLGVGIPVGIGAAGVIVYDVTHWPKAPIELTELPPTDKDQKEQPPKAKSSPTMVSHNTGSQNQEFLSNLLEDAENEGTLFEVENLDNIFKSDSRAMWEAK